MITRASRTSHGHGDETDFWSDVYSGRPIAILNHYGRLHVYLDHILQHNVVFAERQDALAWLIQRIEATGHLPARLGSACALGFSWQAIFLRPCRVAHGSRRASAA